MEIKNYRIFKNFLLKVYLMLKKMINDFIYDIHKAIGIQIFFIRNSQKFKTS